MRHFFLFEKALFFNFSLGKLNFRPPSGGLAKMLLYTNCERTQISLQKTKTWEENSMEKIITDKEILSEEEILELIESDELEMPSWDEGCYVA